MVKSTAVWRFIRANYVNLIQFTFFSRLSYIMLRHSYLINALLLGIILGQTAEVHLYRSLEIGGRSPIIFLEWLVTLALVILILLILIGSMWISGGLVKRMAPGLENNYLLYSSVTPNVPHST